MPKKKSDEMKIEVERENILTKPKTEKEKIKRRIDWLIR